MKKMLLSLLAVAGLFAVADVAARSCRACPPVKENCQPCKRSCGPAFVSDSCNIEVPECYEFEVVKRRVPAIQHISYSCPAQTCSGEEGARKVLEACSDYVSEAHNSKMHIND